MFKPFGTLPTSLPYKPGVHNGGTDVSRANGNNTSVFFHLSFTAVCQGSGPQLAPGTAGPPKPTEQMCTSFVT